MEIVINKITLNGEIHKKVKYLPNKILIMIYMVNYNLVLNIFKNIYLKKIFNFSIWSVVA